MATTSSTQPPLTKAEIDWLIADLEAASKDSFIVAILLVIGLVLAGGWCVKGALADDSLKSWLWVGAIGIALIATIGWLAASQGSHVRPVVAALRGAPEQITNVTYSPPWSSRNNVVHPGQLTIATATGVLHIRGTELESIYTRIERMRLESNAR